MRGGHIQDCVGEERLNIISFERRKEAHRCALSLLLCDPVLHVSGIEVHIACVDAATETPNDAFGVDGGFRCHVDAVDDCFALGAPGVPVLLVWVDRRCWGAICGCL